MICIQDTVHIATKCRNRCIRPSAFLAIGNKIVSASHLKILINNIDKDVHGLVYKDIDPDDRQNFSSFEKIMSPRVLNALSDHVVDSEATVMYHKICYEVVSSFIDLDLIPAERIYRIWHATYFLRIWRTWLKAEDLNSNHYNIRDNFISSNAYKCIEINAHNLIRLIRKLRNSNLDELFFPHLFASQACEETFRQLRSMGTINFTKINFTMLEVMHMIGRVELQNDIVYSKLANMDVLFPRNKTVSSTNRTIHLPSDIEIEQQLLSARETAIKDASDFGMCCSMDDLFRCNLDGGNTNPNNQERQIEQIIVDGGSPPIMNSQLENLSTQSNGENVENLDRFVEVENRVGKKLLRKSTLVWLLSDCPNALSNDRLTRVQGAKQRTARRRLNFSQEKSSSTTVNKMHEIQIGNWCIFRDGNRLLLGNIVGFKYIQGKSEKDKQYSWDFAALECNLPEDRKRGIDVLASWYLFDLTVNIKSLNRCFYVNLNMYIATMSNPLFERKKSGLVFDKEYFKSIQHNLIQYCNKE